MRVNEMHRLNAVLSVDRDTATDQSAKQNTVEYIVEYIERNLCRQ